MGDEYLVWGAGGHGKVVADLIRCRGDTVLGFIDRDASLVGASVGRDGSRVLLDEESFQLRGIAGLGEDSPAIALGVGRNSLRVEILNRLGTLAARPLLHPSSVVARSVTLGVGTVVCAGAIINPDAAIGRAVIVNSNAVLEHDCVLGEGVHVSPGAVLTGGVSVGDLAWLGARSVVLPGLRVGRGAIVGAGAVVTESVADGATVVGNPARAIRSRR